MPWKRNLQTPCKKQKVRKYSTPYDIQEYRPPLLLLETGRSSHSIIIQTQEKTCRVSASQQSDDDIPDEIELPLERHRSCSTSSNKPFCPGADEERNLPSTPGSSSRTKKTLDSSFFSSEAKELLHPLSGVLKRPSQFYNQQIEEGKQLSVSQPAICPEYPETLLNPPTLLNNKNGFLLVPCSIAPREPDLSSIYKSMNECSSLSPDFSK